MAKNDMAVRVTFKGIDHLTKPVRQMQSRLGRFSDSVHNNMRRIDKTMAKTSKSLRNGLFAVGAAGFVAQRAIASVAGEGAHFQQSMVNAGARFADPIKLGTAAFKEMEKAALDVGDATEFMPIQAAQAFDQMARSGLNNATALKIMQRNADFATVAGTDLATAYDIAVSVMGQFGLRSKDSAQEVINFTRVTNAMALAANRGKTTVEEMFEALVQGGAIANLSSLGLETTLSLLSKLGDAGIQASIAGTGIKAIGLGITAPTSQGGKLLNSIVKTKDAEGEARPILDVMSDLNDQLKGPLRKNALSVLNLLFQRRGIAAGSIFMRELENVIALTAEMKENDKFLRKTALTMRDTVLSEWLRFMSTISRVKTEIFNMNEGPLRGMIHRMKAWTIENKEWIKSGVGAAVKTLSKNLWAVELAAGAAALALVGLGGSTVILGLTKVAGAVMLIFKALTIGVTGLVIAFGFLKVTMLKTMLVMALSPFGATAIAVTALVVGLVAAVFWWDELEKSITSSTDAFDNVFLGIKAVKNALGMSDPNTLSVTEKKVIDRQLGFNLEKVLLGGLYESLTGKSPNEKPKLIGSGGSSSSRHTSEVILRADKGTTATPVGPLGEGLTMESTGSL